MDTMLAMEVPRFESIAERRIREAMEAGHFDDLPGTGEPLPGAGSLDDDLWWVKGWLKRNDVEPGSLRDAISSRRRR